MCLKSMISKAICKDMDDKIISELNKEQIDILEKAKIENPKWFSLNTEQADTVKKIAAEYPYSIELVSGIYTEQKFSEKKTRDILRMGLRRGRCK